jgi:uncharacterized protein DUF4085
MKYFTRERYLAQQLPDQAAMDAADADWEQAADRYDAYLQTIRPDLPESVRQLLDGFYLHDARVLSMGQRGESFVISMQLDAPPNELLTVAYTLAGSPQVSKEPFLAGETLPPEWLYDEVEQVQEGGRRHFVHSILFSNGWEARLPFRDVHMATAYPVFPHPRARNEAVGPTPTPQSA